MGRIFEEILDLQAPISKTLAGRSYGQLQKLAGPHKTSEDSSSSRQQDTYGLASTQRQMQVSGSNGDADTEHDETKGIVAVGLSYLATGEN